MVRKRRAKLLAKPKKLMKVTFEKEREREREREVCFGGMG